jgi:hypothetical protein
MASGTSLEGRRRASGTRARIFLGPALHACPGATNARDALAVSVPPSVAYQRRGPPAVAGVSTTRSALTRRWWYGNINPLSIDYASQPRLRSRLTLGG